MKTCCHCKRDKPLDQFAIDRSKSDGRGSWCRTCCNEARRKRYYDRHEHEKQRSRGYYWANRDRKLAYYQDHRQEIRAAWRARYRADAAFNAQVRDQRRRSRPGPQERRIEYMKRHGGIDEWARLYDAQGGCCYLCGQTLEGVPQQFIAVDHDHECCPGGKITQSCSACRRGLAHAWCNQLIGLAGEDMNVLRAIIANFEPVNEQTKQRISVKQREQGQLDLGIAG